MPITPLHFGPGLLLKAALPRRLSFSAFACANVAIDVESLVHLLRGDATVHRWAHTLLGASLVGVVAGLAPWLATRVAPRLERACTRSLLRAEISAAGALLGGLLGGVSHALLDAVMHADARPLAPFSLANPLLGAVSVGALHASCVAAGLLGAGWLALRGEIGPRRRVDPSRP